MERFNGQQAVTEDDSLVEECGYPANGDHGSGPK